MAFCSRGVRAIDEVVAREVEAAEEVKDAADDDEQQGEEHHPHGGLAVAAEEIHYPGGEAR